jgi:hypothetical protein
MVGVYNICMDISVCTYTVLYCTEVCVQNIYCIHYPLIEKDTVVTEHINIYILYLQISLIWVVQIYNFYRIWGSCSGFYGLGGPPSVQRQGFGGFLLRGKSVSTLVIHRVEVQRTPHEIRPHVFFKLSLYWDNFVSEKSALGVLFPWLVLAEFPLHLDEVLQPLGHGPHQVL